MSQHGDPDAQVDEFLELERELSDGSKTSKTYDEGNIAEAAKIPASEVPDDYPVSIRTQQALQLNVGTPDGATVTTYMEWPEEGEQSDHVEKLLDALGRNPDEFANVFGDRVALDTENGWHSIDAEKTAALRGSKMASGDDSLDTTRNLLAGAVAVSAFGFTLGNTLLAGVGSFLAVLAWVAIPATIYVDANRVEETTGWSPKTTRWIAGALVPVFNVPVGAAYLVDRHVRLSGTTSGDVSDVWYKALLASMLALPIALAIDPISESAAAMMFGYGWWFMPFAVYFDAEYVEDATDWDPNEELWAVGVFFTWIFAAGAYLLKRHVELD